MANAVELRNLEKSFKTAGGVIHAVQGLSLTIPAGQRVALIGPNGAGEIDDDRHAARFDAS